MKLNEKKIDMQKVLAPAALVILYVFFSVVGDGFLSMTVFKNILESSYYIGFMAFEQSVFPVAFFVENIGIEVRSTRGAAYENQSIFAPQLVLL